MGKPLAETVALIARQGETVTLPNTGHWLMQENPEETCRALQNFLDGQKLSKME